MSPDYANSKITKLVMTEYEILRRSAVCNMRDTNSVYTHSFQMGLKNLHNLIAEDLNSGKPASEWAYIEIIKRYDFYIKKHKLKG